MILFELAMLSFAALVTWVYFESKAMGLHAEIPPDPAGRARMWSHEVLQLLKSELIGSEVLEAGNGYVVYRRGSQEPRRLSVDGHDLLRSCLIDFRNRGTYLQADVTSRVEPDHPHTFSLRLPMNSAPPRRPRVYAPRLF